jgi:hypothetical protein
MALAQEETAAQVCRTLGIALVIIINYGTPLQKLMGPYADRSEWEMVQIAQ